jgi:hypothetical protein
MHVRRKQSRDRHTHQQDGKSSASSATTVEEHSSPSRLPHEYDTMKVPIGRPAVSLRINCTIRMTPTTMQATDINVECQLEYTGRRGAQRWDLWELP